MSEVPIKRLRKMLADRATLNGIARGPMGYATAAELTAANALRSEAVDALPGLLTTIEAQARRISELEAALVAHNCGTPGCLCYQCCRAADLAASPPLPDTGLQA